MEDPTPQETNVAETGEQGLNNDPLTEPVEVGLEAGEPSSPKEESGTVEPDSPKGEQEEPSNEETFYNAQNVPEELKPTFKKMQGAFTKGMQDVASSKEKAKLYDEMKENPAVRQAMGLEAPPEKEVPVEEKYKGKNAHEIVQEMVDEKVSRLVDEKFKTQIEPTLSKTLQKEAEAEIAGLQEKYPENGALPSFDSLRDEVADLVEKHPEVPIENHYKALAFEQAQEAGKRQVHETQEAKKQHSAETTNVPENSTDKKLDLSGLNSNDAFWASAKDAVKKFGRAQTN